MPILVPILFPVMPSTPALSTARLLIACPDAKGIVASVAGFIAEHGGNLLELEQHSDPEHGEFFMRAEFQLENCDLSRATFPAAWAAIPHSPDMTWRIAWSDDVDRIALLVSKELHCLQDLLWRWHAGELNAEIPLIISNHPNAGSLADEAGVPFLHLPIIDGDRAAQERRIRDALREARVDLVVLARYMQILSGDFIDEYPSRIINVHHSFLPAFAGGDPYRQAYERGVKIIGATSHYVTEELDAGPIIAQEVVHVSHRHTVADLRRKGRDLERMVLSRALRRHVDDKILVSGNKTVMFD
jgi:formyltetrahydrofolate deformylase